MAEHVIQMTGFSMFPALCRRAPHSLSYTYPLCGSVLTDIEVLQSLQIPGSVLSSVRSVNRGAPLGSCTGVQIHAVGTDDIEADLAPAPVLHEVVQPNPVHPDWSFVERRPHALKETVGTTHSSSTPSSATSVNSPVTGLPRPSENSSVK